MMPNDRNNAAEGAGSSEEPMDEGPVPVVDQPSEDPVEVDATLSASTSGRSWVSSFLGGVLSTLFVFVFLGYLQPTLGSSGAITLPDIVQLQTGLGSRRKPPPPPKRERQKKQERKTQQKRPKQVVRNKVQRTKPTRAQQTMQRLVGAQTMALDIGLPGGGGGAAIPINMQIEDTDDEETRAIGEYIRTRDRIRDESRRMRTERAGSFVAAGVSEPQVLIEPDNIYPRKALQDAIEGYVVLNALVSVSGSITAFEILAADPQGVFEDAVIDSLHRWRFSPAEDRDGNPLECWKKLKIEFRLEK